MDITSAYQQVGSYRGAAELCGTTHKTVKRVVEKFEAGGSPPPRVERAHNYDAVADVVADRVGKSQGRISAQRLLRIARTAGADQVRCGALAPPETRHHHIGLSRASIPKHIGFKR
jgi:hypothetical protein